MAYLIQGSVDVYTILQKVFVAPHHLVSDSKQIQMRRLQLSEAQSQFWKYSWINACLSICFCTYQTCGVFSKWKGGPDFEKLAYYTIYIAIAGIFLASYKTWRNYDGTIVYLINQLISMAKIGPGFQFRDGKRNKFYRELQKCSVYASTVGMVLIASILTVFSVLHDYDPIQHYAKSVLNVGNYLVKVVAVLFYTSEAFQSGTTLLRLLLVILIGAVCLNTISQKLINNMHSAKNVELKMSLSLFRQFQIITNLSNIVMEDFLGTLTGLGVVAASSSGFVLISMYNELPIVVYVVFSTPFFITETFTFALVYLGTKPMQNGMIFQQKMAHQAWQFSKLYRKELQSLPKLVEFSLGCFVRNMKPHTSMSMSDVIINYAWTFAVIKRDNA